MKSIYRIIFILAFLISVPVYAQQQGVLSYPASGLWNVLQKQLNVIECNNFGEFPLTYRLLLRNSNGGVLQNKLFTIFGKGAQHIIVNDLISPATGFGSYTINPTSPNPLQGSYLRCHTALYQLAPAGSGRNVNYGFSIPVANSLHGTSWGSYNSYNPNGAQLPTQNWLSLVNTDSEPLSGDIFIYKSDGTLQGTLPVNNLAPGGRRDFPLGHPEGQRSGVYKIILDNSEQSYLAYNIRYAQNQGGTFFALPLSASSGSCTQEPLPISTFNTTNWAEIGNISNSGVQITLESRNSAGTVVRSEQKVIPPRRVLQYFLNTALGENKIGSLRILCASPGVDKLVSQSIVYGPKPPLTKWGYAIQENPVPAGNKTAAAFPLNTHLGMANWLKLIEKRGRQSVNIDTNSSLANSSLLPSNVYRVTKRSSRDIPLHETTGANIVGGLSFGTNDGPLVSSNLLRVFMGQGGRTDAVMKISPMIIPNTRPKITLVEVAQGLSAPLFLTNAKDQSGRLFVVEKGGRIKIIEDATVLPTPFLNISSKVTTVSEQGLLGLAFHPQYSANRRFFVYYTDLDGNTVVAEYQTSIGDPDLADVNSERIVLQVAQPAANHNGGQLSFGPDGFLYIALGDGGSAGDPGGHGQNLNDLLGSILRIDVDGDTPYEIPTSNPFRNTPNAKDEIWAYGFRNPWRFSFDRTTGRLFAGDVGQNNLEEIDLVVRGGNYGWNTMEGSACFSPSSGCSRTGLRLPIAEYTHDEGIAVIGGYVYRGRQFPALYGKYFFGDFGSAKVWSLSETPSGAWRKTEIFQGDFLISSFGEDEEGELYLVDYEGVIYRIIDTNY